MTIDSVALPWSTAVCAGCGQPVSLGAPTTITTGNGWEPDRRWHEGCAPPPEPMWVPADLSCRSCGGTKRLRLVPYGSEAPGWQRWEPFCPACGPAPVGVVFAEWPQV